MWEFFDLKNDPMEMESRYGDAQYAPRVAGLQRELTRLRRQYKVND